MVSRTLRKVSPGPLEWLTQVNEWNLLDPNDHFTGEELQVKFLSDSKEDALRY